MRKNCRKGQVSMEYLLIMGFAFLSVLPIIIIFFTQAQAFNQDVTLAQSDKIMAEIIDAADTVYYQGAPSATTIRVFVPQYVDSIIFDGRQNIVFFITKTDRPGTFNLTSRDALATLQGTLSHGAGMHVLQIKAVDQTHVNITDI
ncbi:MAG: hypothetical protein ABIE94_03470 [archaeon]